MYRNASCRYRFSETRTPSRSSICVRPKASLLPGGGFAPPNLRSQHIPVQLEATGLQTANGVSTIISTSAVTSARCRHGSFSDVAAK